MARRLLSFAFITGCCVAPLVGQQQVVMSERFDAGLGSWERVRLDRRQTSYSTTTTSGEQVLVATSQNSAAAFLRRIETPPPDRAVLEWRWRISESLTDNERERERRGDDYAARVFVIFGDEPFERGTRALSYVWAGQEPVGAEYRNPVIGDVATFVVRSGDASAGRWVREQRNLMADFEDAFGERPPGITGVAVLVDTDDTGSSAISWFDDFVLEVAPAEQGPIR
ncbi:MAG: DUF3047 domain-containing protein [Gemmatimonadota bacterium]|nr:DUF3047 domain-containing protein [Gemmatimonadota bacterium]